VRVAALGVYVVAALTAACTEEGGEGSAAAEDYAAAAIPVIAWVWQSPRDTLDNIDSPAVWHGPGGEHWVISTAKETDVLVISDATTGAEVRRIGGEGRAPGRLDRPNGIAVVDDFAFVVERDNARVQVFALPGFESRGTYGEADLTFPYGIAIVRNGPGSYETYVTDNYEREEDVVPADSLLGERIRHYSVTVSPGRVTAALTNTFGATEGEGVLRFVESLAVDPLHDRLLVAEEQEGASMLKAYTLGGTFRGEIVPAKFFPYQAEGIVLYECDDEGYWVATDQSEIVNTFHVFDRMTLAHMGSFRAEGVLNTDGIALTQTPFPDFESGAFFAVHNDGNVAALRWSDIATPLRLRADCRGAWSGRDLPSPMRR
jgi:3-phytase